MIRIDQLRLPVGHTREQLERKLLKTLRIGKRELNGYHIRKRSLDARKKPDLSYSYSVDVDVAEEGRILKQMGAKVRHVSPKPYCLPAHGSEPLTRRPVVVGSGFAHICWHRQGISPSSSSAAHRSGSAYRMWSGSGRPASSDRIPTYSSERAARGHFRTGSSIRWSKTRQDGGGSCWRRL